MQKYLQYAIAFSPLIGVVAFLILSSIYPPFKYVEYAVIVAGIIWLNLQQSMLICVSFVSDRKMEMGQLQHRLATFQVAVIEIFPALTVQHS
jgi:hypothetical protein